MNHLPLIAAIAFGFFAFAILYKPFFGKKKDFWECVGYSLMPNFLSWLANDLGRDYVKSMKLGFFFLICGGVGYFAYVIAEWLLI